MHLEHAATFDHPPIQRHSEVTASPEHASEAERRYAETVNRMAKKFIYDKWTVATLEAELQKVQDPKLGDQVVHSIERTRKRLEAVLNFCRGVEAHETANMIHDGPWQSVLIHQPGAPRGKAKPPELLTREDVANEFAAFDMQDLQVQAEKKALAAYGVFLASGPEAAIPLTSNITLQRADIQVLMNDLEVRIAERILDPAERKTKLLELNRELLTLIQDLPREDVGKRFELQEIYLLRRLIQSADTGHVAAVSHGTPRKDLNINEGSVDLVITFGGRIDLQIKTYQARVSSHTLGKQARELEYRQKTLEESTTQLSVLRAEAVRDAFNATLRRREDEPTKLADKKTVFAPIVELLDPAQSHRLVVLLGLTEERCRQEQVDFERREREFNARQEERRLKEVALVERLAQHKAALEAERVAQLEVIRREGEAARRLVEEHEQKANALRERDLAAARAIRDKLEQSKRDKQTQVEARAEEKRLAAQKALEAEAAKREKAVKKDLAPEWPPTSLDQFNKGPELRRLGLLPSDWRDDLAELRQAKAEYEKLFLKNKPRFARVFPTRELFDSPDDGAMERLRLAREKVAKASSNKK